RAHAVRRRAGRAPRAQAADRDGPAAHRVGLDRRDDRRPRARRGGAPARPPRLARRGPAGGPVNDAPATEDLGWPRVHPVTPLVRGWTVIAVLLVVVGQQTLNGLPEGENLLEGDRWWMILLGILAVGLVGLGYSALAWRLTSYAVDDESVHLRTGVLFRQQRRARLDRLQAVDVVQPLLARFFGLAELKLEVAGGADSGVKLGFQIGRAAWREGQADMGRAGA